MEEAEERDCGNGGGEGGCIIIICLVFFPCYTVVRYCVLVQLRHVVSLLSLLGSVDISENTITLALCAFKDNPSPLLDIFLRPPCLCLPVSLPLSHSNPSMF